MNKPDDTKKRLFKAGTQIFAEKGYSNATVREICKLAGAANINAINYHYGSKEMLYREILENIFSEYDRFDHDDWDRKAPHEQLKAMISNYCEMFYKENGFTSDIASIMISEFSQPSPFVEEMVDIYSRPRNKRYLKMFQELLGDGATEETARDCLVSVAGQIFYYRFAWPAFSRLFPNYSIGENYEQWAAHVYEFSLGGIEAVKKQLASKKR